MRLLIAEDDAVTRLGLSAAVERLGHEVTAVADGAAAWEAVQKGDYSVVLSDWDMPVVDGAELCRRIRGRPAGTCISSWRPPKAGGNRIWRGWKRARTIS